MSHFYGVLSGSRGDATRCGTPKSGMTAKVASWDGAVEVILRPEPNNTGRNLFTVRQIQWRNGAGINETLISGIIGEPVKKNEDRNYIIHALKSALDHIAATDEDSSGRMVRIALEIAITKAEG